MSESIREPILVFLHGFMGAPEQWKPVISRFERSYSLCLPALPGHGERPWIPRSDGGFPENCLEFAEKLPDRPCVLVGYSMGARIAYQLARTGNPKVLGVLLVGVHPGVQDDQTRELRKKYEKSLEERLHRDGLSAFVSYWEEQEIFSTQRHLPAEVLEQQRKIRTSHSVIGLRAAIQMFGTSRMSADNQYWNPLIPTKVLTGALDEKFQQIAEEWKKSIGENPRLVCETVPGVGHNVLLEAPDALARAIEELMQNINQKEK